MVIRALVVCCILGIAWLSAGRGLTEMLDRVITIPSVPLRADPLRYDGGGFRIGGLQMTFAGTDNLPGGVRVRSDDSHQLVLTLGRDSFALGPRTDAADSRGIPDMNFVPAAGDEVSFTARQSLLGWPTPFEIRILGGAAPWWRRYVYYRLVWQKPAGATLEMRWRYEKQYYAAGGWTQPEMMWRSHTGLVSVKIARRPEPARRR